MRVDLWDEFLFGLTISTILVISLQTKAERFFKIEVIKKEVPLSGAAQKAYMLLYRALGAAVTMLVMTLIALWVAWWQIRKRSCQ